MKTLYRSRKFNDIIRITVIIFIIGVFAGSIGASLLKGVYEGKIEIFNGDYFSRLRVLDINYKRLFGCVIWHNYKIYLVFWLFTITMIGIPYLIFSIFYSGICTGFLISAAVMQYGLKGILMFLTYLFPQYIIYIPAALLTIVQGYRLCTSLYFITPLNKKSRIKLIVEKLPIIIFLAFIIFLGSILETYINSYLVQSIQF